MSTEKTKGDILAERIEAIKSDFDGLQGLSEILGEALADYHAPEWTLGRSVNGFTLAEGQEWHRTDFTKDMLSNGERPLLNGERRENDDEVYGPYNRGPWTIFKDMSSISSDKKVSQSSNFTRTRRPLPVLTPAQIADGWVEWHGGECPVWGGSTPKVRLRDGEIKEEYTANVYRWDHWGSSAYAYDIIAYRPDPYEALKKAHSEGKMIQYKPEGEVDWSDLTLPTWTEPLNEYRIKPSPVMVPLGPEDVKCGDEIRHIHQHLPVRSIISKDAEQVVAGGKMNSDYRYEHLQKYFEINRNDGKGFVRCEKEAK